MKYLIVGTSSAGKTRLISEFIKRYPKLNIGGKEELVGYLSIDDVWCLKTADTPDGKKYSQMQAEEYGKLNASYGTIDYDKVNFYLTSRFVNHILSKTKISLYDTLATTPIDEPKSMELAYKTQFGKNNYRSILVYASLHTMIDHIAARWVTDHRYFYAIEYWFRTYNGINSSKMLVGELRTVIDNNPECGKIIANDKTITAALNLHGDFTVADIIDNVKPHEVIEYAKLKIPFLFKSEQDLIDSFTREFEYIGMSTEKTPETAYGYYVVPRFKHDYVITSPDIKTRVEHLHKIIIETEANPTAKAATKTGGSAKVLVKGISIMYIIAFVIILLVLLLIYLLPEPEDQDDHLVS